MKNFNWWQMVPNEAHETQLQCSPCDNEQEKALRLGWKNKTSDQKCVKKHFSFYW